MYTPGFAGDARIRSKNRAPCPGQKKQTVPAGDWHALLIGSFGSWRVRTTRPATVEAGGPEAWTLLGA
jgi:hypothetical protein